MTFASERSASEGAAGSQGGGQRRADAEAVVAASGLPDELGALVLGVVRGCRLWKGERAEVARELCAHFRDGLESGVAAAELAGAFGDPAVAAKLISATRRKLRPRWWRALRAMVRSAAVCLLVCICVYAVLALRFYVGSPNVARNIIEEMNAAALAAPRDQRAWPLYLEAKRRFGVLPEFMLEPEFAAPTSPDDRYWDRMAAWLDANTEALAAVRLAASKPVMGYRYSDTIDPELVRVNRQTMPGAGSVGIEPESENPMLLGVLLPHLGELRRLTWYLQSDIALAARRGDGGRYVADVRAVLGMAGHLLDERFLISNLVGIAIADVAFRSVTETAATAGLLDDAELRELAHAVGGFAGGRIRLDVSGELLNVDDMLQRFFSDDGRGGGHYVGGPELDRMYDDWGVARPRGEALLKAYRPIQSVMIASRREIREQAERFIAAAAVDDALPPWRHDERSSDDAYRALEATGIYSVMPIVEYLRGRSAESPVIEAAAARDLVETRRAAALTALAAEAYRRDHGAWPASLSHLVPAYLPRVPLDPFDGAPLRYIGPGADGTPPRLYSVGVDQVDEGGAPPEDASRPMDVYNFEFFKMDAKAEVAAGGSAAGGASPRVPRGDWVLWPL